MNESLPEELPREIQRAYNAWLAGGVDPDRELGRRLNRHLKRSDAPLLLQGEGGAAAAVAGWLDRQLSRGTDRIFFHHVGATRESRRAGNLVLELLRFIKRNERLREPLPVSQDGRLELLPNWLARAAARERVAVVITRIDMLEAVDETSVLDWLPDYLPPGIRLVLTAASDATARLAETRGYQRMPAPGETDPELPAADDGGVLAALWCSRFGLDGDELRRLDLSPPDTQAPHLYRNHDRWLLAGPAVQDRVRRRHLADGVQRQAGHHRLADRCFARTGDRERRMQELPWQLAESDDRESLRDLLLQPGFLGDMLRQGWREELVALWGVLGEPETVTAWYAEVVDAWAADAEPARLAGLLADLIAALQDAGAAGEELAPLYQRALAVADSLPPAPRLGLCIARAAWLGEQEGQRHGAGELLQQLVAEAEERLGEDAAEARRARHALATVREHSGDLEGAAELYRRTLEARQRSLGGQQHAELLPYLTNLAAVLKAANEMDAARPLYQRALAIAERAYGNAHPGTAACLDNLAGLLYAGQDFAAAEDCYQRALGIAEQAFGPGHPATAASAHNLATALDAREQFRAAEGLFRRALEIRQEALGEEHMDTASSLHNLAGVLDAMGRYDEAEPMYRRAVETWEKVVGRDHPATATSVNNLADLLRERGQYEEAEGLYRRNLDTWSRLLGERHPHTVMTLAELACLYADRGDHQQAEPLLRQAVEQTAQVMGVENMQHISAVTRLAALLRDRGDIESARQLLRQASRQVEGRVGLLSPALQKLRRHLEALDVRNDMLH